jgi:DNA modification methylase
VGDGPTIFDPVLCELAYRWWCPAGGQIVDPFAGGSVRGIVAGALGNAYWGCDLRAEQIEANVAQADAIPTTPRPEWICGDSMAELEYAPHADFVFSCPPYGDLEKYSDDPQDLSAMEWHTFAAAYGRIILRAVGALKPNRFACFVVGDFRDKRGFYRDFVSLTIKCFRDAGAELYNEAILASSVGSASMRVTKQFNAGRKLVKTHQNVLVFCKGDWRKAADAISMVEAAKIEALR